MSWAEYQEWRLFDAIEPFGGHRADWQAASVGFAAAKPHLTGSPTLRDFLPFDERRFDPAPDDDEWADHLDRVLDRAAARAAAADRED